MLDNNILEFLAKVRDLRKLRIYVQAHSCRGKKTFYSDELVEYKNPQFAGYLARHLKQKFSTSRASSPVTVNFSCLYGAGILNSGAADFQLELNKLEINAIVVARTQEVEVKISVNENQYDSEENEITVKKLTDNFNKAGKFIHKQPGSKVIFHIDEKGYQIAEDAYGVAWKKSVLFSIDRCSYNTSVTKKEIGLRQLHLGLRDKTPHQVLGEVKAVASEPKSIIDKRSFPDFWSKTNTRLCFEAFIEKGKEVLDENSIQTVAQKI